MADVLIANKLLAYFAAAEEARCGVVVIQEWWGLNEWMRVITTRFAAQGVAAVCPDLYHGKVAKNEKEASHLMSHLDWNKALEELQAALNWLKEVKEVKKVAVMGFCMGGALSIAAGTRLKNMDAGICFYGIPPLLVAYPKDVKCKMQFHFGELDDCKGFSDPEAADQLEKEVKEAGVQYEFFRYPNCKHAFMNNLRPNFNKDANNLAFNRALQFIKSL